MLCIYVDDFLVIEEPKLVEKFIRALESRFTIKVNKDFSKLVGCEITWQDNAVVMKQRYIINKLIQEYQEDISDLPKKKYSTCSTWIHSDCERRRKYSGPRGTE